MAATAEDVITTLKSIDASLKALCRHFGAWAQASRHDPAVVADVPAIASDADLDAKYGDPEVRAKSPRDWTGESQSGKRFSQCPPEYLDLVAARLEYFAQQNETVEGDAEARKKARFNRLDASRARGWAQRLRNGWKPPVDDVPAFGQDAALTSDDIAF